MSTATMTHQNSHYESCTATLVSMTHLPNTVTVAHPTPSSFLHTPWYFGPLTHQSAATVPTAETVTQSYCHSCSINSDNGYWNTRVPVVGTHQARVPTC